MIKTEIEEQEIEKYYCDICNKFCGDYEDVTRCGLCHIDTCGYSSCASTLHPLTNIWVCTSCYKLASPFVKECIELDNEYSDNKTALYKKVLALKK